MPPPCLRKPAPRKIDWAAWPFCRYHSSAHTNPSMKCWPGLCLQDSSQADVSTAKADSNTTGPLRTEKVLKSRKKTFRIPLSVSGAWSQPGLTAKQKQVSRLRRLARNLL